jgi:hypothetical protein
VALDGAKGIEAHHWAAEITHMRGVGPVEASETPEIVVVGDVHVLPLRLADAPAAFLLHRRPQRLDRLRRIDGGVDFGHSQFGQPIDGAAAQLQVTDTEPVAQCPRFGEQRCRRLGSDRKHAALQRR